MSATPDAPAAARRRLQQLGPLSSNEVTMLAAVLLAVALWVAGGAVGVSPVAAAMLAMCLLLLTGTLTWGDCLTCQAAWDALFWFAGKCT